MEKEIQPPQQIETVGSLKKLKVVIVTKQPPEKELRRAAEIIDKLRYYTNIWQDHFGAYNKNNKERWEKIADEWRAEHIIKTII